MKLKILDLFAGTKSISNTFAKYGHDTFAIDWDKSHNGIDWYTDIGQITAADILEHFGQPQVIWASPDCSTYSVAAISHHRIREADGNLTPKSDYAKFCDVVIQNVIKLIEALRPVYYFIENPRGGLRKMNFIKHIPRYTTTYCQWGESRMKPTDIFTNHPTPNFKPACKNGDSCHVAAPRGARTGTQGIKGSKDRSRIPEELCVHMVKICTS
ncbi:DNA cytosine methyltransferase [Bacillus sp. MM2020_1]|nr:DNA cytosine methyltransferase [Bacillus sp. MM2020_1]